MLWNVGDMMIKRGEHRCWECHMDQGVQGES